MFRRAATSPARCSARSRIVDHLTQKLRIRPGETTGDGRFTLSTVECLASCGTAPVVMINETCHECVTPQKLDALLETLT